MGLALSRKHKTQGCQTWFGQLNPGDGGIFIEGRTFGEPIGRASLVEDCPRRRIGDQVQEILGSEGKGILKSEITPSEPSGPYIVWGIE